PPLGASVAMVVYAWLMLGADYCLTRMRWAMHGIAVLLIATVKWIAIDTLAQRLSPDWSAAAYPPVLNPLVGVGVLLAASLLAIYWLRRDSIERAMPETQHGSFAAMLASVIVAMLTLAFSFEIDRVVEQAILAQRALTWPAWQIKLMGWTILWSASAV